MNVYSSSSALTVKTGALTVTISQMTPSKDTLTLNGGDGDDTLDATQVASHLASIHLNGEGGNVGPSLNGLRLRHDREWVKAPFADPDKLSPGSEMPPFNFKPEQLEQITSYIMSIPK